MDIGTSFYHADIFPDAVPDQHLDAVTASFKRAEKQHGVRFGPIARKPEMEPGMLAAKPGRSTARVYVAEVVEAA